MPLDLNFINIQLTLPISPTNNLSSLPQPQPC
jgi:hypothetical protein